MLRRKSVACQLADLLESEVRSGRWKDVLPDERSLAKEHQVGRHTVRAALTHLENEGLITLEGRTRRVRHGSASGGNVASRHLMLLSPLTEGDLPGFERDWLSELRRQLAPGGLAVEFLHRPAWFRVRHTEALDRMIPLDREMLWLLHRSSPEIQTWMQKRERNALVMGQPHPGVHLPWLALDQEAATRHVAATLQRKKRRHWAYLKHPEPSAGQLVIERSLASLARTAGCGWHAVALDEADPVECVRILERRNDPPDAWIVQTPPDALRLLTYWLGRGVRWPGDRSLISWEYDAMLGKVMPPVAHLKPSHSMLAKRAARWIRRMAMGERLTGGLLLIPDFEPGGTL